MKEALRFGQKSPSYIDGSFHHPLPGRVLFPETAKSAQLHMAAGRKATAAPYCLITCNNLDFYLRAPF